MHLVTLPVFIFQIVVLVVFFLLFFYNKSFNVLELTSVDEMVPVASLNLKY